MATAEAVYRVRGKQEGTPRKKKVLHVFTSRAAGATPAVVEQDQLHVFFPYLDPLFGSGHMASEAVWYSTFVAAVLVQIAAASLYTFPGSDFLEHW